MAEIRLIVGLGNPGVDYEGTRHNAGAFFVRALAHRAHQVLRADSKFHGETACIRIAGRDIRLLVPTTFMNRSGKSVAALANFFRITPEEILIAHDELDIPVGQAKLKQGGGHGGHNGLRDIAPALGNNTNFHRLRIGIGHPGHASKVAAYVLSKPSTDDREAIQAIVDKAIDVLPLVLDGEIVKAKTRLHTVDTAFNKG